MNANQRTGLIAIGVVCVGFALVGAVFLVVVAARKNVDAGGILADGEDKVRTHRWWKKPLAQAELDGIVDHIVKTNAPAAVFVDGLGKCATSYTDLRPHSDSYVKPQGLSDRTFWLECKGSKRPDRNEVLARLAAELDRAEYRDGPGR